MHVMTIDDQWQTLSQRSLTCNRALYSDAGNGPRVGRAVRKGTNRQGGLEVPVETSSERPTSCKIDLSVEGTQSVTSHARAKRRQSHSLAVRRTSRAAPSISGNPDSRK